MSDITPRQSNQIDRRKATREQMQQIFAEPTLMLPRQLQLPAARFWMCFSHMRGMESQLQLCSQIATWLEGSTEGIDVLRAFKRMSDPAVMCKYRFGSDLIADLGALVADERRARISRDDVEQRRKEAAQADKDRPKVRAMVAEFLSRTDPDLPGDGKSRRK